jgi:hypothetical protein
VVLYADCNSRLKKKNLQKREVGKPYNKWLCLPTDRFTLYHQCQPRLSLNKPGRGGHASVNVVIKFPCPPPPPPLTNNWTSQWVLQIFFFRSREVENKHRRRGVYEWQYTICVFKLRANLWKVVDYTRALIENSFWLLFFYLPWNTSFFSFLEGWLRSFYWGKEIVGFPLAHSLHPNWYNGLNKP